MIRTPRRVSPAPARVPVALPYPQKKLLSGVRADLLSPVLASPPMNSVPLGYFTQLGNTPATERRTADCLYATPHGAGAQHGRQTSTRLPVRPRFALFTISSPTVGLRAQQHTAVVRSRLDRTPLCCDHILSSVLLYTLSLQTTPPPDSWVLCVRSDTHMNLLKF